MSKLTRKHKTLLFVLANLDSLVDKGLLVGGRRKLTPSGLEQYNELVAAGFKPTPEEMYSALDEIMVDCGETDNNL